ncbi:MAG: M56 family metallopeptidase [Verrucomicrobia bacterium]|nr:M56 family metallopeptidase [Verrucomicrobiota bacterium]
MNADTIGVLNFVIHSLVIGAAAWLLVRFVIRDALQRCILANLAVLMCLYSPFHISMEDLFPQQKEVPVWTPIRETFKADWRVSVTPAAVAKVKLTREEGSWSVDEVVRGMRWGAWMVAAVLLIRLLVQCVRVQRWAWGLRRLAQGEADKLPRDACFRRLRVFETEGTPCVAGWFFPVLAVPAGAFQKLTERQWGWVLRHEAEHLRLHDTVVVLLQNMVRAFLWWNPFAYGLIEEYARAREEACDAAAVGEGRDHTAYADFLLAWADRSAPQLECVMAIAYSRPAKRLKVRLVALMEARGVRKKLGALFVLGCLAFAVVAPLIAASFGIATAAAQETIKSKADDGAMYTREYKVAPHFLSGGASLSDPMAPGAIKANSFDRKTARQLLEQHGVSFPTGASAIYNPATSRLIVRNTKSNIEMMERVIDTINQRSKMVHFNCKLVASDQFFGTHGSILSADEFQTLFRGLSRMKGIDVMSSPNVTTRFDQNAIAEVAREVPPKKLQDGTLSGDPKFVGLSIEMNAKAPVKGKFTLETKVNLGLDPDSETPWLLKNEDAADWDKVCIYSVAGRAELASGETLLLHLPTSKGPVTALVTATLIAKLVAAEVATEMQKHDQVQLTVQMMEVSAEGGKALGAWDPGKLTWRRDAAASEVPISEAPPEIRHVFNLCGILTEAQFQTLAATLKQKKGMDLVSLPEAKAKTGQSTVFDVPAALGGKQLRIKPLIEPDGGRIRLTFQLPDLVPAQKHLMVTEVTLWDGQTLVLSGIPADKAGITRMIFVSAKVIGPEGKEVKK